MTIAHALPDHAQENAHGRTLAARLASGPMCECRQENRPGRAVPHVRGEPS